MKDRRTISLLIAFSLLVFVMSACNGADDHGAEGSETEVTWQEQYDLGIRYLSEGNYQEAIIAFTAAIEIDPKQAPAYVGRGDAYVLSGETEDNLLAAKADYETAIELEEKNVDAWLGLADIYIRQGDYERAMEILREGLEKSGNNSKIKDTIKDFEGGNISDSSGKTRRETTYDGTGVVKYRIDYTYDTNGRRHSATSYDDSGTITGYAEYTYNDKGQIVEGCWINHPGTINPMTITLDADGREIRSDWYWWSDGSLYTYSETEYDSKGNRIEWRVYNTDGILNQRNSWEYSAQSVISRETQFFYSDGEISHYSESVYNTDGNPTKTVQYSADGSIIGTWEYQYNDKGFETGWRGYDADGVLGGSGTYEYDENGKRVRETLYDGNGNIVSITEIG